MMASRKVVRHYWPQGHAEPWVACMGRKQEGLLKEVGSWAGDGVVEHITTPLTTAVNCKTCTSMLPDVRTERKRQCDLGMKVAVSLAALGFPAEYKDGRVSLDVDEAASLLAKFQTMKEVYDWADVNEGEAFLRGVRSTS